MIGSGVGGSGGGGGGSSIILIVKFGSQSTCG